MISAPHVCELDFGLSYCTYLLHRLRLVFTGSSVQIKWGKVDQSQRLFQAYPFGINVCVFIVPLQQRCAGALDLDTCSPISSIEKYFKIISSLVVAQSHRITWLASLTSPGKLAVAIHVYLECSQLFSHPKAA